MTFEMEMAERSRRADELVREGRAQLRQLVLDGHRRGLSQRRIAALTNRSQAEVSRLLREIGGPVRTWMTARGASEAIKEELQRGHDDFALRTLIVAINDFRDLSDSAEIREVGYPFHCRVLTGWSADKGTARNGWISRLTHSRFSAALRGHGHQPAAVVGLCQVDQHRPTPR